MTAMRFPYSAQSACPNRFYPPRFSAISRRFCSAVEPTESLPTRLVPAGSNNSSPSILPPHLHPSAVARPSFCLFSLFSQSSSLDLDISCRTTRRRATRISCLKLTADKITFGGEAFCIIITCTRPEKLGLLCR